MTPAARSGSAAELRELLVSALVDIPFMSVLPDRRLLINLIRRDVKKFPDVEERPDTRLHVVEIVLACLGCAGGLHALRAALMTMAPNAPATKRVCQLIDSATLSSLLPDAENERITDLLRRAEASLDGGPEWQSRLHPSPVVSALPKADSVIDAFRQLANQRADNHGVPPALALVIAAAAAVREPLAAELHTWADEQADWLKIADEMPRLRGRLTSDPSASPDAPLVDVTSPETGIGPKLDGFDSDLGTATEPGAEDDADVDLGETMGAVAISTRSAGKLPQVWGDVPQRNFNFTGREEILDRLHEHLRTTRETAVLPQALHGMGGVGKSQVAIEYVHRHSAEYDLVWWIPAEQPGQILGSLVKLAERLELSVSPEANSAVPAVREALSTGRLPYRDWLLVFDNAEAPEDVRPYFPTGGAGKILVTSRNADWGRDGRALEVDVFTRAESIAFLTARNADLTEHEAGQLAEALGDLPLAVEQAAAWRTTTGMPVKQYLELLEKKRLELLELAPSPDYGVPVAAAWNVSLDSLRQVNEAALQLLQVCSFFAPEPITRDLFDRSPETPMTPDLDEMLKDPLGVGRAIRDIQRYALARLDRRYNTLQIHRLVQLVVTGSLDAGQQAVMRRAAHILLANAYPGRPDRREFWNAYLALRPHVMRSEAVQSDNPRVHDLVFNMIKFLYFWGDHSGSEELAQQAYDARVKDRGEADPHTLAVAKWLGFMLFINGRFDMAKRVNDRTLAVYRKNFPADDEGTIDAMTTLAGSLRHVGEVAAAMELDEQAYTAALRALEPGEATTQRAAHSLAVSLRLCGDFRRALALDEENYTSRVRELGPDDADTLNSLNNLVAGQRELGRYLEARDRQENVYRQHVEAFGEEAPGTLRAALMLAVARRKAGDHPGALQLAEETLGRYRRRYGDDYPHTISMATNYAIDLRHAGRLAESRALSEETLARYVRVFGTRHPHTLAAHTNLAIVLRITGDAEAAYRHDREALEALRATLGEDHPVTLVCATNLASDLYVLDDAQAAYERDTDTLARSERVLGVEHPSTLACSVNLALDLRALDRVSEADHMLADTMKRYRRVLGERHPATLNALQSLRADCDVDPMLL